MYKYEVMQSNGVRHTVAAEQTLVQDNVLSFLEGGRFVIFFSLYNVVWWARVSK